MHSPDHQVDMNESWQEEQESSFYKDFLRGKMTPAPRVSFKYTDQISNGED